MATQMRYTGLMSKATSKAMTIILAFILVMSAEVFAQDKLPQAGDQLPAFRLRNIVLHGTGRVTQDDYVG